MSYLCSKCKSLNFKTLILIKCSMFFHLLYIHLFRPFLKYNPSTSPLPSHVSPRKLCTQAAASVSKLMRLYKRTYGLRQICNIAVYIVHSACTIHLLNLPDKTAKRDIIHGVKHLEEIAEDWLCARRTLSILSVLARKWKIDLPEEASAVFARTDAKFGFFSTADVPSPKQELVVATPPSVTTSPPRVGQSLSTPPLPPQNRVRTHNQLQESLYSYRPDSRSVSQNTVVSSLTHPGSISQDPVSPLPTVHREPIQTGIGSMAQPVKSLISTVAYPRHSYNVGPILSRNTTMTPNGELSRNSSGVISEASGQMTRQVSPNTMFGGVDALVESQDWWLRDQASLVLGFDNWMGVNGGDISGGLSDSQAGNANPMDADSIAEIGAGFYMVRNSNGHGNLNGNGHIHRGGDMSYGDDDWTYG